jgi:adenylate cyclase
MLGQCLGTRAGARTGTPPGPRSWPNLDTALEPRRQRRDVHRILAAVNVNRRRPRAAIYHQERASALNPNYDLIVVQQGEILTWLGRPEEGIEWIREGDAAQPASPERFWSHLGRAHFVARSYREAIDALRHVSKPDHLQLAFLAASHAQLGEMETARGYAQQVLAIDPQFTVEQYMTTLHYKLPEDAEHHREALLAAGLPK